MRLLGGLLGSLLSLDLGVSLGRGLRGLLGHAHEDVDRGRDHAVEVDLDGVDAGLAASVFHFGEIAIPDLKQTLWENDIIVRR